MSSIEDLYKSFGILADAKENAGDFPDDYQIILNSSKGSNGEKRLGAGFIPRFFKYFPDYQASALNCILDLCEDEDFNIRRLAIKALPSLCYETKDYLMKIADVLTQLLPTGNAMELAVVQNALREVIELDAKGAVLGIFSQINAGDDESREHAVNFLRDNVLKMIPKFFDPNPEASDTLVEEIRKALPDVTGEEFQVFISLMSKLKSMQKERDALVELIAEQADLESELQPTEMEALEKFITCTRAGIPFFKRGAKADPFFVYIVEKVLPVVEDICSGDENGELKLDVYKILAEICASTLSEEILRSSIEAIFQKLLLYMPLPVSEEEKLSTDKATEPQIEFSYVECLIYSFHQAARKCPEFLTANDGVDKLRDFKLRLQYVGQRCQVYIKQLKMSLDNKTGKDKESEMKVIALRTTSNIHTLIKDLLHSPISYNSRVALSWIISTPKSIESVSENATINPKQEEKKKKEDTADVALQEKRKRAGITPITFDMAPPPKKTTNGKKPQMKYYLPPGMRASADDSTLKSTKSNRGGFRGRGRGRGGWRGYNRGWKF